MSEFSLANQIPGTTSNVPMAAASILVSMSDKSDLASFAAFWYCTSFSLSLFLCNRTADMLPAPYDKQCLYEGQCKAMGDMKKPLDSSFTDIFVPNCGVVATSLTPITGCLISTAKTIVKYSAT